MTAYIIRRLIQGLIVLILCSVLVFTMMRLLPGDPLLLFVVQAETSQLQEAELIALRHEYGLDKSIPVQYINWIAGVLRGDLGTSIWYSKRVSHLLAERLPITLHLGLMSTFVSSIFGILAGVVCALRRGRWSDTTLTVVANIGITAPSFWVGILLIYFLGLQLRLLPVSGYISPFEDFWLNARQVIMPVICLSLFTLASLTRQTRSSMLEVIQQEYIRTAWSKGLRERVIIIRHAIKNALIPVITLLGFHVAIIFGGSVLIETVFNIPGVGRLMVHSIFNQDYQVAQGIVLLIAVIVVLSNLAVDLSYGWFDPRIRYA